MFLKNFLCFSSNNKYTLDCHLSGDNDAILCLAVSNSGKTLASRGYDGLRLWDLEKKVELRKPSQTWNPQDPITCLGYLFLWKKHGYEFEEILPRWISMGQEVMAISCDTSEAGMQFHMWYTPMVQMLLYLGCIMEKYYRSHQNSSHTLCGKDGVVLGMKSTGRLMGGVAVDLTCTFFVINNATNGFSLHCMDDALCMKTYDTKSIKTFPKQVVLAEEATVVVVGGEDGWVHVFDRTISTHHTTWKSMKGRVCEEGHHVWQHAKKPCLELHTLRPRF
ncbi:hypothetical protein EDD16DRAFT_1520545 [Pisolithus croceorrhizus]|nr:hypothetical protein EDD16DRAFT_1520545 [Pisolithus croceorrhizus]